MPPPPPEDQSLLEAKRERLYAPVPLPAPVRSRLASATRFLQHAWQDRQPITAPVVAPHHIKWATTFFVGALTFFGLALVIALYLVYVGGESVSVNHITLAVEGPSTIAGGDTVPITIAITNRNPVEIQDAALEVDLPPGSRSAEDVTQPLLAYNDTLGTIKSGETVTRSIKAVVFGTSGQNVTIPVSLSYGTAGSNSTFVKKYAYPISISSTPLSISVETVAETVAGKPITLTLLARSNATVPLGNVVVEGAYPFGFSLTSSSLPADGTDIALGTLAPGASKSITLTGTLDGQDGEARVFHFSIGTAGSAGGLALTYMTQDASVKISAPFLSTSLTLAGAPLSSATLAPATTEDVTLTYANRLATNVNNASISVTLSGAAVDYSSVRATNGFYDSATHTIIFSKDSDVALAVLAPGTSGVGAFSFTTVPASAFGRAPAVTFTTSIAGTRIGENNVPEQVSATKSETIKAVTAVELAASSLHAAGPFANSGPIPPAVDKATTYAVDWAVANAGSTVAGGAVSTTLPSYVTYTGKTSGQGRISYDEKSRTVTWTVGDLAQGASAESAFQVSLTPSVTQRSTEPALTGKAAFTGFDRFAGVNISASAEPVTTETVGDPGYSPTNAQVQ